MDTVTLFYIAVAILNTVMATALVRYIPRYWREFPWLPLLTVFFLTRAIARGMYAINSSASRDPIDLALDLIASASLIGILLYLDRMIRGLTSIRNQAQHQAQEYARARLDYGQLVRHRLANPLSVIIGGLQTLQERDVDPGLTVALLDAMCTAARQIEALSLEPDGHSEVERDLDAIPRIATEP